MTNFANEADAVTYIFQSMRKLRGQTRPPDDVGRDPTPTRRLIEVLDLLGGNMWLSQAARAKAAPPP